MQRKLGLSVSLRNFLFPRNNLWLKRIVLIFSFVAFDYLSTLLFCQTPHEEANLYARLFMENLGVPLGLTFFVLVSNAPIYVLFSLNSHLVRFPIKFASAVEICSDFVFAWFIAGLHFYGGTSWFWQAPDLVRQGFGAFLYLMLAFILIKPHKQSYGG